ncbi:alpha-amylase family protein [Streptomyces chiangmaiensis]|uniref:Glycosyl hydrolase family 13 catalytic domain-containing protein n=1 Tax=Streptomyces chiangmaiensis TaxID=766497 RepID=A0ABU7FSS6_9ACTN|nr:hypothetical protein [Streptomyces chiangmaiensis]MED7827142.1 hypothetical protein [Streptomyces chiangmaiensis]
MIHEINAFVWLGELSARLERPVSLGSVPGEVWDEVARTGVDTVWLMGVWERSPAGLRITLRDDAMLASFRRALPDLTRQDIVGSPYCVRNYVVDERLGGPEGPAAARGQLAARGVRLMLDYVPNHVAPDHPWLTERPGRLVRGTPDDLARAPESFLAAADRCSPAAGTRTSHRGRTWSSSTHSARSCVRLPWTRWSGSATRRTACAAT